MTASVHVLDRETILAALLRDAVEEFEDAEMSVSSVARLCAAVMDVADRLEPPVRLVTTPLPVSGARRLLEAIEAAPDYIRNGDNADQSRRVS